MKFSDKNRNVNLELPVKITYEGKEFWIKKATKTDGIYLNSIEPPKTINQDPQKKDNDDKKM